ncbi:hypothetical protein SAMN05443639_113163 [Stigmatella erecta]|uniref:Uncharacterized protein n=1 Tax=Stigmatella erecta TaxID=83460 RepID=A0A1I0KS87_9BACT|nr:hypothetical protein SAMN05443639_113163 [Stigmatella erecta]
MALGLTAVGCDGSTTGPLETQAAWETCNSFSVTQVSTGARICGMKCTDNTYYRMDCKADIFANGFDIVATE